MFWTMRGSEHFLAKPDAQRLSIGDGGLTIAKLLANLCPMVFDRTAIPVVIAPALGRQIELLGHVGHDLGWYLTGVLREPPFVLEILQKHGEAQAGGARLIAQKLAVLRKQRPMFD